MKMIDKIQLILPTTGTIIRRQHCQPIPLDRLNKAPQTVVHDYPHINNMPTLVHL